MRQKIQEGEELEKAEKMMCFVLNMLNLLRDL